MHDRMQVDLGAPRKQGAAELVGRDRRRGAAERADGLARKHANRCF